jgi:hypothetical protein
VPQEYRSPQRQAYLKDWYSRPAVITHRKAMKTAYDAKNADRIREWTRQNIALNGFLIRALKREGCVDCGESDPVVLDFDHVFGKKTAKVTGLLGSGQGRLINEAAKCEVRCANCHRRATHARRLAS